MRPDFTSQVIALSGSSDGRYGRIPTASESPTTSTPSALTWAAAGAAQVAATAAHSSAAKGRRRGTRGSDRQGGDAAQAHEALICTANTGSSLGMRSLGIRRLAPALAASTAPAPAREGRFARTAPPVARPPRERAPDRARTPVRREIQALRALAVTLVVVFHLWPSAMPGGFAGVDVFFAISGFLITAHLLREIDRTGRVGLAAFWARRARRLLPPRCWSSR